MTSGDKRFLSEAAGGVAGQCAAHGAKPRGGMDLPATSGLRPQPAPLAEGSQNE